jgi:hypothetical protein
MIVKAHDGVHLGREGSEHRLQPSCAKGGCLTFFQEM